MPRARLPILAAALLALAPPRATVGQAAPVRLVPAVGIGCALCGGPEEFGVITALAFGDDRLLVADRDEPHIRVFDLEGRLLTVVAPDGDGPGELRMPMGVASDRTGMNAVDMRQSRVVHLAPDGSDAGTVRLPSFPLAVAYRPGGGRPFVALANFQDMTASVAALGSDGEWSTILERVDAVPLGSQGGAPMVFSLARAPEGGFAIGVGVERYLLLYFTADGTPAATVQRDVERLPKSAAEIESERAAAARFQGRVGGSPEAGASLREVDPLRRHFSIDALRFDGAGRLWVRTDRGRGEQTVFDLFGPDRAYLGEVRIPARVRAFTLGNGLLAGAVLDEYDVGTVRVWRVEDR